jgi:hypothetical protein
MDTHEESREMAAFSQPVTADAIETQLLNAHFLHRQDRPFIPA